MEILGKGSFGAVFRVRRMEDGKDLAMKCESYRVKKQVRIRNAIKGLLEFLSLFEKEGHTKFASP